MAEQDTLIKKPKKFLFDLHSFDDKHQHEEEPEAPPPPVFSEEELFAAKEIAFELGRQQGLAEAAASREEQVSQILVKISGSFSQLYQQEDSRMATYERESVRLSQHIFQKLFPAMNEAGGLHEITRMILQIIKTHRDKPEIIIEVQPGYESDIEDALSEIARTVNDSGSFLVRGNSNFGAGDCRLSWKDGGAIRDVSALADEIFEHLDQILVDKPLADRLLVQDNKTSADEVTCIDEVSNIESGLPRDSDQKTETGDE